MSDKLSEGELLEVLDEWMPNDQLSIWGRKYKKQIVALIKKPEITKELIEKKARELFEKGIIYPEGKENEAIISLEWAKDFIRSLVEEIQGEKQTNMATKGNKK